MRRVVLLLSTVALVACRRDAATNTEAKGAKAATIATGAEPSARPLLPGATCAFPDKIDADVTVRSGCVADVIHDVLIARGATLTLEPGVTLRFQPSAYLEIGHQGSRLVARGTREQPIRLTSAQPSPKPGDWIGLILDDAIGEGTVLEHAIVEYAGRESHGGRAALTAFRAFPPGRVAVRDVIFRNNLVPISNLHEGATFAAFERNVLTANARAMRARLDVLAAIGLGNELGDGVEVVGGTVRGKGTLRKGAYRVIEPIYVNGDGNEVASLTIAKGAELRFASKTWLETGTAGPAELVASGVTFTSAESAPKAGDWVGLIFGDKTRRGVVTDARIEYAGAEEHGGDAAVTFVGTKSWQALDVMFTSVTFRHIRQAHFSSNGDGCSKALDPRRGIGWAGFLEPCR
ncbi:MAG: hypothetical protein HYV09_15745 [Deltaproteobacteria bacterium]|nr:hypothetical protein [Deltaproteobacteria bacterium]